jgi:anti-anti-sigma factor
VYVRGELDHQTAPRLRVVIDEEWGTRPHALILDLSQVSYIDSGGLALIFDTLARFKNAAWLGVVGATAPVTRLMEMTGLTDRPEFRMLPDLAAASVALENPTDQD